jgi:prepilin-type N-terminal cleavage/methylation domain-containing protein
MRKKGFTLVELLVVIAIIAMLLAILMPALNRVKQLAYRLVCGTNLGGLGKAITTYSNDNSEQYPLAGNTQTTWNYYYNYTTPSPYWDAPVANLQYATGTNFCNITSSLYLLVKYAEVGTGSFVCKATDQKKFELLSNTTDSGKQNYTTAIKDPAEAWDFGASSTGSGVGVNNAGPWDFCSYSYQMPYKVSTAATGVTSYPMSASSSSGMAVMADASPWWSKGARVTKSTTAGPDLLIQSDWTNGNPKKERLKLANSKNHAQEGQNVLYNDAHVNFENGPNVGVEQDNIYTAWTQNATTSTDPGTLEPFEKQGGVQPSNNFTDTKNNISQSMDDSFLVN